MSGILGHGALGDFELGGEENEPGGALAVRTQPTVATFPTASTRGTFPASRTRAVFPAATTSVTVPIKVTTGTFYTEAGVLVG